VLGRRPPFLLQIEAERPRVVGDQAVRARLESDSVHLQSVTQPGLGDAPPSLEFGQEAPGLGVEVLVQLRAEGRSDPGEEDPAVARGRVRRQVEETQCDPPGGRE
jgi:hypothetical protein